MLVLGLITTQAFAADQWAKIQPASGSSPSDLSSFLLTNNEAVDRLSIINRVNCTVLPNTSAAINVLAGTVAIPNSGGTIVRWRRNTSTTAVTWADIDAGAEAGSTQYYIYAVADADAATFTILISTNATTPTGATYYRKIGYFYNNSSSNIVSVGNIKEGDVSNAIITSGSSLISTTSTSYIDMTDMVVYFVSSGRPVKFTANAACSTSNANERVSLIFDVDGTDKTGSGLPGEAGAGTATTGDRYSTSTTWQEVLTAGAHTVKLQWKISGGTGYVTIRNIIIEEL